MKSVDEKRDKPDYPFVVFNNYKLILKELQYIWYHPFLFLF